MPNSRQTPATVFATSCTLLPLSIKSCTSRTTSSHIAQVGDKSDTTDCMAFDADEATKRFTNLIHILNTTVLTTVLLRCLPKFFSNENCCCDAPTQQSRIIMFPNTHLCFNFVFCILRLFYLQHKKKKKILRPKPVILVPA